MSYRVKRINPFWLASPLVTGVAVAATAVALIALQSGRTPVAAVAGVVCGVSIFLATKPALSAVFAVFGLLGGVVTFLASPGGGMSPALRLMATVGFSLFYMVLMDGVVLSVSAIYNFFTRAGFGALSLHLED